MARLWFGVLVVTKVILWGVIALGLYIALRALIDGEVGVALLIAFIVIPIALWIGSIVLGVVQLGLLYLLAIPLGKRRDLTEMTSFSVAVADAIGAQRMSLRAANQVRRMYEELPPRQPGQPTRSGPELIALYEHLHEYDESETEGDQAEPSPS
jgi:hypothetical protein